MSKIIKNQLDFFDLVDGNTTHKKDKSITNFHRIKSMSLNSLADWIDKNCSNEHNEWHSYLCETSNITNKELIIKWLKETYNEV